MPNLHRPVVATVEPDSDRVLGGADIASIVLGAILLLVIIGTIVVCCLYYKGKYAFTILLCIAFLYSPLCQFMRPRTSCGRHNTLGFFLCQLIVGIIVVCCYLLVKGHPILPTFYFLPVCCFLFPCITRLRHKNKKKKYKRPVCNGLLTM